MNLASFLLCLVFAAIGYVIHPMLLPNLVDSKLVGESALSDEYKNEQAEKAAKDKEQDVDAPGTDDPKKTDIAKVDNTAITPMPEAQPEPKAVVPTPVPAPTPTPEPTPVPAKAEVKLNDEEFINALQSSVKAGDVNEFKFDQVVDWKRVGEQLVDGGTYDVGLVTYKAQTIFDEQQLQAKALIKNGKVVKWLWATTNTQMR